MIYIDLLYWLDDRGFCIGREIQADDSYGEYVLARMMMNDDGSIEESDFIMGSKHEHRLIERYKKELENNKTIIMDIRETLQNLTIPQLESLKPSYYQLAINARIAELKKLEKQQAKPVEEALAQPKKKKKDATSSTKRKSKKATA